MYVRGKEVPAGGQEVLRVDPAGVVELAGSPACTVGEDAGPHDVPVALHYRVRPTHLVGLPWVEARVDPSEDHESSPGPRPAANLVPPVGVEGVAHS